MIVVTGGAGFIGSNLIHALNKRYITEILIVEDLENKNLNFQNLKGCMYTNIIDKNELLNQNFSNVEKIIHLGATTNTTVKDYKEVYNNNYLYSSKILEKSLDYEIPFIYASSASVYGNGDNGFREQPECENPLNFYAESKLLFDNYVRNHLKSRYFGQILGMRFFNVFGPKEENKNKMASMITQAYQQLNQDGKVRLFTSGEQKRDFIYIKDLVKLILYFFDNSNISGIYNFGSGKATSFNEIVQKILTKVNGKIEYIPIPSELESKFQKYTKADLSLLSKYIVIDNFFTDIFEAIDEYISELEKETSRYL